MLRTYLRSSLWLRIKITTYLFAIIIQSQCVELDKTGDDMTYIVSTVDDDRTDFDDENNPYQLTTMGEDEDIELTTPDLIQLTLHVPAGTGGVIARIQEQLARSDKSIPDFIKTMKWTLYSKNYSVMFDAIPAVRTDVIAQLQEQRSRHANKAFQSYDINYAPPEEAWPAITFKIPKAVSFTFPTPPSLLTRTFRDHFQYFRDFRPTLTFNSEFLSKKSSEVSATRDISAVSKFWKHFFTTAEPVEYAVYGIVPNNLNILGLINNPAILTRTSTKKPALTSLSTDGELDYQDDTYEEDLKRYYERHENAEKEMLFMPFGPDIARDSDKKGKDRTKKGKKRTKKGKKTTTTSTTTVKKTTTTSTTTTTTTTRTTRHYPRPNWICYECGRNETKFGSSFCYDVFDNPNNNMSHKMSSLRYRCIGNLSMAYQCFKRFVDIDGYYNERGCRDWPPRTSGKTYASKRLRALENMLKDTEDGCVFTPQAFLLSLSRSVQLYVRFHVCVCKGTLCNGALAISAGRWILLIILSYIGKILSAKVILI